jgi:hypothetical protein
MTEPLRTFELGSRVRCHDPASPARGEKGIVIGLPIDARSCIVQFPSGLLEVEMASLQVVEAGHNVYHHVWFDHRSRNGDELAVDRGSECG